MKRKGGYKTKNRWKNGYKSVADYNVHERYLLKKYQTYAKYITERENGIRIALGNNGTYCYKKGENQ